MRAVVAPATRLGGAMRSGSAAGTLTSAPTSALVAVLKSALAAVSAPAKASVASAGLGANAPQPHHRAHRERAADVSP
jgi:hypothetical protein